VFGCSAASSFSDRRRHAVQKLFDDPLFLGPVSQFGVASFGQIQTLGGFPPIVAADPRDDIDALVAAVAAIASVKIASAAAVIRISAVRR
jgi:hypothetical protein